MLVGLFSMKHELNAKNSVLHCGVCTESYVTRRQMNFPENPLNLIACYNLLTFQQAFEIAVFH